ncbi:unnamed protein product [Sphagnum balticum]
MSENQKPADTRSASQKFQDLENGLIALYQTVDNIARDLNTAKDAIKLLGNKIDSIVKASVAGEPLSDDVISRIMIENNVEELKNKLKVMVAQGILASTEQVAQDSFVVGQDINDQGEVINPRLQFALYAIKPPELQQKFLGAKVGDVLNLQEGKLKFKVAEIYQIQQPKPAQAAPAESEAAPAEQAPEASAAPASDAAPASLDAAPAAPEAAPAQDATVAQPDQTVTPSA